MKMNKLNLPQQDFSKYNLYIILDACRYDMFKKIIYPEIDGELERRWSTGGDTEEFLMTQVSDNDTLSDAICITGQPWCNNGWLKSRKHKPTKFKKIEDIWKLGWSNTLNTTLPDTVVKSVKAYHGYSGRLLIWFLQPHWPFLKKEANILQQYYDDKELSFWKDRFETRRGRAFSIWKVLYYKGTTLQHAIEGYHSNLKILIPYIKEILKENPRLAIM